MAMPPLDLTLIQALLSSKTISDEISSADDLTTPGFYFVENTQLANMPSSHWSNIFVNANTSKNRILQICVSNSSPDVWFRSKRETSWSAWNKLATMNQVTSELTRLLTTVEF